MAPALKKKELENLVDDLNTKLGSLTEERDRIAGQLSTTQNELAAAQAQIIAAQEATAAVEAARDLLQQQLDEAVAAAAQAAPLGDQLNVPQIPRPTGPGWSIRESMQVTPSEYAEIQRTVRSLVIRAMLDWTDDFRRQDPDKLATLFRAARAAHPILQRYVNNWATAAIARQYMQNKRKHAYKQGYISKRRAHRTGDGEN
ncbi:hypothetical protein GSI_05068 [Ganoderma sinense ZZ0214-1]|uniref:Uncharacterized protein n=1 Tax=Ganoderma sinense ZZ0214-1 TaxID=1077348 RepID=A0A2G8SGP5_9APHY|nr:hypothetical protein GSI_05068 [Ganoderma sinense ZZ0214-1]